MNGSSMSHYTETKEKILADYSRIWFTALSTFPCVLYVDGFAGSGVDKSGKDGSPLVALEKAAWSWERHQNSDFSLYFIEKTKKRFVDLERNIEARYEVLRKNASDPLTFENKVRYSIFHADFHSVLPAIVSRVSAKYCPAFFFVDPYNCQIPMKSVVKMLSNKRTEILLNFMVSGIVRNRKKYSREKLFDIFGEDVDQHITMKRAMEIVEYYSRRLKNESKCYVLKYGMLNKKASSVYYLVFATKSPVGIKKMKEVLHRNSTSQYAFTNDFRNPKNNLYLFKQEEFESVLRKEFSGRRSFSTKEIEKRLVETDEYLLCSKQVKEGLRNMEKKGLIEVSERFHENGFIRSRRKNSFPVGSLEISFK